MDEGLLNDLLECSVCLERLDTSSRVLPCQHTFCLKCLKEIVESHKELRCPECRVLVEAKVEELPPNVLLMRILEGMRNSAPRKPNIAGLRVRTGHSNQASHSHQSSRLAGNDVKPIPPHGRAVYDYVSKEPGDLSFKKGDIILLQKRLDTFWYQGECSGRNGVFPITYVQIVVPLPVPSALCKALYDFRMSAPDEEGCLAFDKGAIITVHRRVDENWAEGRLEDRVGIFPIAFVELNQAARQLMNSTTRPVPPIPELTRAGHSDHRHHVQQQHSHRYQQMSMSTPATQQITYQNVAAMSQSHPNFHQQTQPQILIPQSVHQHPIAISQGGLLTTTAVPRNIMEPTHNKSLDLIHLANVHNKSQSTVAIQSVRLAEGYENRLRSVKFESYGTPIPNNETTYQNMRTNENLPASIANFNTNNISSDSSSSVHTPCGASSTTTPNTSSDTSASESAEPSIPSSPDNNTANTERNTAVPVPETENEEHNEPENSINTSMGVLSLNESSTATNTSLNVSLPAENEGLNASTSSGSQNQSANTESQEQSTAEVAPSSSKQNNLRINGPESLFNFGLGLQAALSPSHAKDSAYMASRSHREHNHREKEKRNSLTPATHLQGGQHSTQNRHSAEILATSLLDYTPERDRERERERRRRRSRSNERPLPAPYIALYPYKPQKSDELELKKGGIYVVSEKCRDGWYKGCSERTQRCGVFPGNYVAPASNVRPKHEKVIQNVMPVKPVESAPDAPPRALTPPAHSLQHSHHTGQPASFLWSGTTSSQHSKTEKSKERSKQEKSSISSGVSLMKRLTAMKKCKSPPPMGYSMDNPVFDDGPGPATSLMLNLPSSAQTHLPVHVRSGSCPSQLLRSLPGELRGSASHRLRAKERPSVLAALADHPVAGQVRHAPRSTENPWQTQHRKSQSLDVTVARRDRHHSQTVKEKFRCIVPYPPNSEYELELKVGDIVLVHRKRGDGWYKGTLQRTGRAGLFPASFVQLCPPE